MSFMKLLPWKVNLQRRPPTGWRGEVNNRLMALEDQIETIRKATEATRRKVYRDEDGAGAAEVLRGNGSGQTVPTYRTGDKAPD